MWNKTPIEIPLKYPKLKTPEQEQKQKKLNVDQKIGVTPFRFCLNFNFFASNYFSCDLAALHHGDVMGRYGSEFATPKLGASQKTI